MARNIKAVGSEKREKPKMTDADIAKVREKLASFALTPHVNAEPLERRVRFYEHCGLGRCAEYLGRVQLHVWPGNYEVWQDRIEHYEKAGGRYGWPAAAPADDFLA